MTGRAPIVKALDVGLAKLARAEEDAPVTLKSGRREGAMRGTLASIAPEQAEGKPADTRTDISPFGAKRYEMATGTPAFHPTTPAVTLAATLRYLPPAVIYLVAAAAKGLEYIMAWCQEKVRRAASREEDVKLGREEMKPKAAAGWGAVFHSLQTACSRRTSPPGHARRRRQ